MSIAIEPVAETAETVTLRRTDYQQLLAAALAAKNAADDRADDPGEDAADRESLAAAAAREAQLGVAAARADHLPAVAVARLLAGEHPVRVWRAQRGFSVSALAALAGCARSYVAEIESRRKPGSAAAYRRLAAALGVTVDDLLL